MKRLVLTGAAGRLGSYLREPLSKMADELVSTDIVEDFGTLLPNERYIRADIQEWISRASHTRSKGELHHAGLHQSRLEKIRVVVLRLVVFQCEHIRHRSEAESETDE